jgi:hypothetical protein
MAIAAASTGLARVGETRSECEQRYGALQPGKFNEYSNVMEFKKENIECSLVFDGPQADAKCVLLYVTRADGTPLGAEIRAIMGANKGDAQWNAGQKTRTGLGSRWDYTTTDGRLHAFVVEVANLTSHLTIESSEWAARRRDASRQKEIEAVRGF